MGASYVILIPWKQCYLIVPIVSKRTEHISAGALEIMLASYVAWSLESSANHSCHPFQYSLMDDHDHHLIITTQTNTSLLTLMYWPVWYQHPIWCRYADMQRCRYADMHQFPRIKSDTHKVELPIHLDSIVVQVCAWSHRSTFRQSDKFNHGSILYRPKYCLFAISAVGIPAMNTETDKHTLHRLYFLGNP